MQHTANMYSSQEISTRSRFRHVTATILHFIDTHKHTHTRCSHSHLEFNAAAQHWLLPLYSISHTPYTYSHACTACDCVLILFLQYSYDCYCIWSLPRYCVYVVYVARVLLAVLLLLL